MKTNLTATNTGALVRVAHSLLGVALLPALLLFLTIQPSHAGSATWKTNPLTNDWNTADNWTPATVPHAPSDTATFNTSTQTAISFPADSFTELDGIIYNSGSSGFTTTLSEAHVLIFEGAGITNNSAITQSFVLESGSRFKSTYMSFLNSATAGSSTSIAINGGALLEFIGSSSAGSAAIVNNGGQTVDSSGGGTAFNGPATAGSGTFTNNGGAASNAAGGGISFGSGATAGNAIITNNGTTTGDAATGGSVVFDDASADAATLIANSGVSAGGAILLSGNTNGGTARVEVFGNGTADPASGTLDVSSHTGPALTIGSLEGSGLVNLGTRKLTIGSNNLTTTFSGVIQDAGGGGSLAKIGRGKFTLSNANTYTGGTTVTQGSLLVTNRTGSATGTGAVTVNGGIFGGTGKVSGAVTIGTATKAATLAPGSGKKPGKLTTTSSLTFNAKGVFQVDINSARATVDQLVANGVMITNGATVLLSDSGTTALPSGTVFTIISNTAATPITGIFSNLADGSMITVGSNTYLVSYSGGSGNDLTLTVQ